MARAPAEDGLKMKDACLVIDTSNQWTIVALIGAKRRIQRCCNQDQSSFRLLAPLIQELLREASIVRPAWIVAALGPGSFTGIRIGVSTARNLAQLWNIPVRGIDSLRFYCYDLISREYCSQGVAVMLDARQQKIYAAYMNPLTTNSNITDSDNTHSNITDSDNTHNNITGRNAIYSHTNRDFRSKEREMAQFLKSLPVKTALFADKPEIIRSYLPPEERDLPEIAAMTTPQAERLYELASMDGGPNQEAHWEKLLPIYLRQDPAHERYPHGFSHSSSDGDKDGSSGGNGDGGRKGNGNKTEQVKIKEQWIIQ